MCYFSSLGQIPGILEAFGECLLSAFSMPAQCTSCGKLLDKNLYLLASSTQTGEEPLLRPGLLHNPWKAVMLLFPATKMHLRIATTGSTTP